MKKASGQSILNTVESILSPRQLQDHSNFKILMVGPEVTPYANVGGVSRVMAHLSTALYNLNYDVRLFMPKFGSIDSDEYDFEMVYEGLKVPTDNPENPYLICNVKKHQLKGMAPVYFLENREYYELRANVYGHKDDPVRWALLSRGVLEYLRQNGDWMPDIIHANDWQTGTVPNYLKTTYEDDDRLEKIPCLYTIHNLTYQGMFDHNNVSDLEYDDGKSPVANFFDPRLLQQNLMRRGIMYADAVNTVSPTYAREILKPEHGEGLDRLLVEVRSKLSGVLNAIDYEEFNPSNDRLIESNFDVYSLEKRVQNKLALQLEFDLEKNEDVPVFGYVGRLQWYKGFDLMLNVIPTVMKEFNAQFVFIGGGEGAIAGQIRDLQEKYPNKVGAHLMADFDLPRLLFAGSDVVMVPSSFEPCGLVQMEAMRYGAIPLVHNTGGLADSVENYNPDTDEGFGFVFQNYDQWSFFAQLVRALETYRRKDVWRKLQKRAMMQDNSWENRAQEYVDLYSKAVQLHRRSLSKEGKISALDASFE